MVTVADAKVEPKHYVTVKSDLDMIQLPPNSPPVLFSARASPSPSPSPAKRERERNGPPPPTPHPTRPIKQRLCLRRGLGAQKE